MKKWLASLLTLVLVFTALPVAIAGLDEFQIKNDRPIDSTIPASKDILTTII